MKRAIAYTRVSSYEQGKSGFGTESQRAEITAYANENGYNLVRIKSEIGSAIGDDSYPKRYVLHAVMAEAKKRKLPVIVSRLDRISRNADELERITHEFEVEFISISEPNSSDLGALRVEAERIRHETYMLKQRTKAGIARAKSQGMSFGNKTSLALAQTMGAASNRLKAESRLRELRPLFRKMSDQGLKTAKQLAAELNKSCVLTPSGKPWTAANASKIRRSVEQSDATKILEENKKNPLWGAL